MYLLIDVCMCVIGRGAMLLMPCLSVHLSSSLIHVLHNVWTDPCQLGCSPGQLAQPTSQRCPILDLRAASATVCCIHWPCCDINAGYMGNSEPLIAVVEFQHWRSWPCNESPIGPKTTTRTRSGGVFSLDGADVCSYLYYSTQIPVVGALSVAL